MTSPSSRQKWLLFLISFLSLYFELVCIRWLPGNLRMLAYFTNTTLISCLVGMAIGLILPDGKWTRVQNFFWLWSITVILMLVCKSTNVPVPFGSSDVFLWNRLSHLFSNGSVVFLLYILMVLIILLTIVQFIPVGRLIARYFDGLPPLTAYSLNIAGSLLGVAVFSLISLFSFKPYLWFLLGFGLMMFFVPSRLKRMALLSAGMIALVYLSDFKNSIWSPYYQISIKPIHMEGEEVGFDLRVNQDTHQQAMDLSGKRDRIPFLKNLREFYELPFRLLGQPPKNVLIIGAGSGNDVSIALKNGASHIDAVDIDPQIIQIGRTRHPLKPYSDDRVTLINNDGRAYIQRTHNRYDLIQFGFVDSHALFSSMSSVRLDNYLYTKEFFQTVKDRLNETGILTVSFCVHEKWIADRIYSLLRSVFNQEPLVYQGNKDQWGVMYLAGKGIQSFPPIQENFIDYTPFVEKAGYSWPYLPDVKGFLKPAVFNVSEEIPSDDWPHLYLKKRTVPLNYFVPFVFIFAIAFFFLKRHLTAFDRSSMTFFFLGAGFMLIETKTISELAIFFGSTWVVNSFAIGGILLMILFANAFNTRFRIIRYGIIYALLFASLALDYFLDWRALLAWNAQAGVLVATVLLSLPLLFAGLLFAATFRSVQSPSRYLAANLFGAILGGALEYTTLILGMKSLYLIAIGLYFLSAVPFILPRSAALNVRDRI